ncbi:MAG TPA: hypothetical protein VFE87_01950 [Candidatus Paceibacterota bacterium]|nr:hypothetical protein [Candidatus Paceibacterota bacterium]
MQELARADIFFLISTLAVVLVTAGLIGIFYYLIRILKNVHEISERAKKVSEEVETDIESLRSGVKSGAHWFTSLLTMFSPVLRGVKNKRKNKNQ